MRALSLALLAAVVAGSTAVAQELQPPPAWQVRLDRPSAPMTDLYYVDMPPGWHVTTGPAAILYDPARRGTGNFTISSEIFQFPTERTREAFGVFFGGRDLEGDGQAYVYFLIRGDGRFLVKQREGRGTETLVPWTPHEAILPRDGGSDNVKNVLRISAGSDHVVFFVNDREVARLPRADVPANGIVGLRVNHGLNLHITTLDVTQAGS